jgi:hypothetical protein
MNFKNIKATIAAKHYAAIVAPEHFIDFYCLHKLLVYPTVF